VLVGDTQHEEEREERYAEMLKRKEADGLIFLGHRLPEGSGVNHESVAPRCAPVVNGCEFSPRLGIPSVHIDNAKAAAEAMAHLYSLGHRRIGIVTGPLVSPLSRDRLEGAYGTGEEAGRRARLRRDERRLLDRVGRSRRHRACWRGANRRPRSSVSTTRWRWAST
jgi:LacI family repressor for deo operon, udp, cdd, tsx, nupC, and nupG